MESPLIALFQLVDAFTVIGIDYVVVGSIASSLHGDYRASADIDVIADINGAQIHPLVQALSDDFYIDDLSVSKAIAQGRSFNVIHLAGIFKFDVSLAASDLSKQQLARRELHPIAADKLREIWIASAEDTIWQSFTGIAWGKRSLSCNGEMCKGFLVHKVPDWISAIAVVSGADRCFGFA